MLVGYNAATGVCLCVGALYLLVLVAELSLCGFKVKHHDRVIVTG